MPVRFLAILCLWTLPVVPCFAEAPIDFGRDIQPLLAERCLTCHGVDNDEGGLRLHRRAEALKELESGAMAIVAGDPSASEILARVSSSDEDLRMPPEGDPLTEEEIALLTRWISEGARYDQHWAYRPLNPEPENVEAWDAALRDDWSRTPIDAFVLSRLHQEGIAPSASAARPVLIKRLYYDLLGLPPAPEAVTAFVEDSSPDAYERIVDRLLASPHFAERWGRHWLDMARYADSDGYEKDRNRPQAWRYRDWVLKAINEDLPFDEFTVAQLAGDLVEESTSEEKLATAFHRQTLTNTEGGTNPEQWRVAAVMDRTETLGTVWLGLTVGCARCHSHKYDELSHAEYYQLFAFFNNADEMNSEVPKTPYEIRSLQRERERYEAELKVAQTALKEREGEFPTDVAAWEASLKDEDREKLDEPIRAALDVAVAERNDEQKKQLNEAYQKATEPLQAARKAVSEVEKKKPASDLVKVRVVGERAKDRRQTHILRRGEFLEPLESVNPESLAILPSIPSASAEPTRLELAKWLVSDENPLTSRVIVNHLWQYLFGQGIVATPNDFGVRGDRPTHPRLLDYLANRYRQLDWSRKAMIREIVLSQTYRQSSVHRPELAQIDPLNRWLSRQNRFRVEAETLRDVSLSIGGLLDQGIGGPSVFPPMPPEVAAVSYANSFKWATSKGGDRYRRGLYTFFKRTAPHPTLMTFDCPDANVTNVQRNRSNTPLGALTMLNNIVFAEAAAGFAQRILASEGSDEERLATAIKICLARSAEQAELESLLELLADSRAFYQANPESAEQWLTASGNDNPIELAAWASTLRVLLNLDEFMTRE